MDEAGNESEGTGEVGGGQDTAWVSEQVARVRRIDRRARRCIREFQARRCIPICAAARARRLACGARRVGTYADYAKRVRQCAEQSNSFHRRILAAADL